MATLWKKVSGTWAVTTAWSRLWKKVSGVWTILAFKLLIYTNGVQNLPWGQCGIIWGTLGISYSPYLYIHAHGYGKGTDVDNQEGAISTTSDINVMGYTYLCFDVQVNVIGTDNIVSIGLGGVYNDNPYFQFSNTINATISRQIIKVPIHGAPFSFRPVIQAISGSGNGHSVDVFVYNCWAE